MTQTSSERRYEGARQKAITILYETGDGDRSMRLFRAGVTIGKVQHFACANPAILDELVHYAMANGAKRPEAKKQIGNGIEAGKRTPNDEKPEKLEKREGLDEFLYRKRLARSILSAYSIEEVNGVLVYPVPPMPVPRLRKLTRPSQQLWQQSLGGVPVQLPYGLEQLTGTGPVYVVNGESSVWACYTAGVDAVCFCRGEGAAPSASQAEALTALGRPVRVVYDLDVTGEQGSVKVVEALRAVGCEAVGLLLPAVLGKGGDVNDLWVRHAPDGAAFAGALSGLPERVRGVQPPAPVVPDSLPIAESETPVETPAAEDEPPDRDPLTWLLVDACPGIPAPATVAVPEGYEVTSAGVWKLPAMDRPDDAKRLVCHGPVAVVGYSADAKGVMRCVVAYCRPFSTEWQRREVGRDELMEARKVSGLSKYGLPVTSGESAALVRYLAASEAELGRALIAVESTVQTLGFHPGGFLRGFHRHGTVSRLQMPEEAGPRAVLGESIAQCGTLPEWKRLVFDEARRYPVMRVAMGTAFLPLLLDVLGCPMFVLDLCGQSSQGKTTTLRIVSSMWGDKEYMQTWEGTPTGFEHLFGFARYTPVLLDDTKVGNPAICSKIVYAVVSGKGKARGTGNHGMRETPKFKTIVVSTGEGPLADAMPHGGLKARCLSLTDLPMGERSHAAAAKADRMVYAAENNYGHVAAAGVEWVLSLTDDERNHWRQVWQDKVAQFVELGKDGSDIAPRLALNAGAIETAWEAMHVALGMTSELVPCWDPAMWVQVCEGSQSVDRGFAALQDIFGLILSSPERLYRAPKAMPQPGDASAKIHPQSGYIAHLGNSGAMSVPCVTARQMIDRNGYVWSEVLQRWKESGWISKNEGARQPWHRAVRFPDGVVTCYTFSDAAKSLLAAMESGAPIKAPSLPPEPEDDDDTLPF